jgi:hypothetical protein
MQHWGDGLINSRAIFSLWLRLVPITVRIDPVYQALGQHFKAKPVWSTFFHWCTATRHPPTGRFGIETPGMGTDLVVLDFDVIGDREDW